MPFLGLVILVTYAPIHSHAHTCIFVRLTLFIKTDCSKFLQELQIFPYSYQVPQLHLPFKPVLHRINMASILIYHVPTVFVNFPTKFGCRILLGRRLRWLLNGVLFFIHYPVIYVLINSVLWWFYAHITYKIHSISLGPAPSISFNNRHCNKVALQNPILGLLENGGLRLASTELWCGPHCVWKLSALNTACCLMLLVQLFTLLLPV